MRDSPRHASDGATKEDRPGPGRPARLRLVGRQLLRQPDKRSPRRAFAAATLRHSRGSSRITSATAIPDAVRRSML